MFFYFLYKFSLKHADILEKTSAYFFIRRSILFKTLYFSTISQAALIFGNADLKTQKIPGFGNHLSTTAGDFL